MCAYLLNILENKKNNKKKEEEKGLVNTFIF